MCLKFKNGVIKSCAEVGAFVLYELRLIFEIIVYELEVLERKLSKNLLNEVGVEDLVGDLDLWIGIYDINLCDYVAKLAEVFSLEKVGTYV